MRFMGIAKFKTIRKALYLKGFCYLFEKNLILKGFSGFYDNNIELLNLLEKLRKVNEIKAF